MLVLRLMLLGFFGLFSAEALRAEASSNDLEQFLARDMSFNRQLDVPFCKTDQKQLLLDLYDPQPRSGLRPAVLILHGGGWNGRDKSHENFQEMSEEYARRGFVVFNANYRLAADAPAPAAVQDAHCAVRFIHAHAHEYAIDPERVVVTGNSAGCHLGLMVALCNTSQCRGQGDWQGSSHRLRAVVNRFAITDVYARAFGEQTRSSALRWLGPDSRDLKQLARDMSPLEYVRRKPIPPILTIHGEADSNTPVSDGIRLHEALQKAGNISELYVVPGGGHGLHNISKQESQKIERLTFNFLFKHGVL